MFGLGEHLLQALKWLRPLPRSPTDVGRQSQAKNTAVSANTDHTNLTVIEIYRERRQPGREGGCRHDFSCWWLRLKSPARGSELSTSERVSASRGSAVLFSYGERGPHLDGLHSPAGHEHMQRSGCGGNEGRCACLTPAYISHAAACVPAPHAQAPAASTGPPLSHR